jgi:Flp pilus assembly protein TadD
LGPLRLMFGKGWLPLAAYAAAIIAFGSIKWFTDAIDASSTKTILLAFLLTSTTLHFYYDGFIWKVSERGTQQNLGIETEGKRADTVPGLFHAAKWAGVAALAAMLFCVESFDAPRNADDERASIAALAAWTPDVPELLVRQSHLALSRGEISEAIRTAEQAVTLRPASADAQASLGNGLLNAGQFEPAADALRQAVALAPDVAENHHDLALALSKIEQWDEAERQLGIAANQQPQSAKLQKSWGDMSVRRGALDAAALHYRAALALEPESPSTRAAIAELAELLLKKGNALFLSQQNEEAEQRFREAIELSPALAMAHGNLGAVLIQLGRIPEAKQELLKAIELTPDNAQGHCNLGYILLMQGELSQARTHLLRAERLGQSLPPELRQAAGL